MTSNFGGKKAAPFRKGGKRRVAKAVVAKAKSKREMALAVVQGREIDLNWAQWNEQHKGANRNNRNPRKPHPAIIDGVKVHVHLIVPTKFKGKPGFKTPDGNVWGSREDAVAHMTKTAKQRASVRRKKAAVNLSNTAGREIDLGRDGSKWKHGWIPLNASAAALKAHKGKGAHHEAPSMEEHAKIIGRHVEAASKEAAASSTGDYIRETPTHVGPRGEGYVRANRGHKGPKYTVVTKDGTETTHNNGSVAALELHNRIYGVHKSMGSTSREDFGGKPKPKPNVTVGGKPAYLEPTTNGLGPVKTDTGGKRFVEERKGNLVTRHYEDGSVTILDARKKAGTNRTVGHVANSPSNRFPRSEKRPKSNVTIGGKPAYLKPDHSSDVDPAKVEARKQELIDNAEKMHGTGSKQHLAALARFGTESQKRAAAYQIREGNPKTRTTGTGGKKATELKGLASMTDGQLAQEIADLNSALSRNTGRNPASTAGISVALKRAQAERARRKNKKGV